MIFYSLFLTDMRWTRFSKLLPEEEEAEDVWEHDEIEAESLIPRSPPTL
jgi:hypothetical protein